MIERERLSVTTIVPFLPMVYTPSMKKALLFTLILSFLLTALSAQEYVHSTEHFDFIYSDETEESAAEIVSVAEGYYSKLVAFFDFDPEIHIPVYFESDYKQYNAHYSSYSSSHIVMYVTSSLPELFSNTAEPFRLTFYHELTHAFTASISNGFFSFLRSVFGDIITPGSLYLDMSFVEGIAVYVESTEGEGRLNDPYSMALISEISAEGFPFTSHADIAGGLDIAPSGNLSYIAGAGFLEYLGNTYSPEKVYAFIRTAYLFPISTTNGIFRKTFGISIKDAWNGYIDSSTLTVETEESVNITGWGGWNNLVIDSGTLYVKDSKTSSVCALEKDGSAKERIALSYSYPDDLSFSPSFILSPYVGTKERSVSILKRDGRGWRTFSDYYTGLLLSDEYVLLLSESDRNTVLECRSIEKGELISSWELGRDITVNEGVALSPTEALFLVSQNGSTSLLHVDTEKGEPGLISFDSSIYIHSLSMNEDSTIGFSYIEKDGLFTKYGEYDPANGTYRLSGNNFKGGVYYPVKDSGGVIYYVSSYVYGKKVSRIDSSSLTFGEEMSVTETEFVPSHPSYSISSLEKRRYNPLEFMKKGVLLPVSGTAGLYTGELSGLGFTATNIDASEKHILTASIGYAFEKETPTMMVGYSYCDYFSTTFSAFRSGTSTSFEWNITGKWTKNLGAYNRNITLSDTVALYSLNGKSGAVNRFTFVYSDLRQSGIGRWAVSGWAGETVLENISPSATLYLYLPRLIPVENTTRLSYNLPLRLSVGVTDAVKRASFLASADLYLFTWEIQKSVDWLSVYLQYLNFMFSYRGTLESNGWSYSDSYSLKAKLSLTPLIGSFSQTAMSLNAALTYTSGAFRFSWNFAFGG